MDEIAHIDYHDSGPIAHVKSNGTDLDPLNFGYGVANHKDHCRSLIRSHGFTTVCEIGGGRSPLFSAEEAQALRLEYTVLDISEHELQSAPDHVRKVQADICAPDVADLPQRYDFMFSRMLAEHASDGTAMHRNILHLLRPGGLAFHFFPTLFTPVFVVNRLLPERAARRVLFTVFPWRRKEHVAKFPARYSKCFGPTPGMKRYFERLGYQVEEYRPFYGTDYLWGVPVLGFLDAAFTRIVTRRRSPLFSSYVWLVLRKPAIPMG